MPPRSQTTKEIRIAVFASGEGSNLRSVFERIATGALTHVALTLVISNNSGSGAMQFAKEHGVPSRHLSTLSAGSEDRLAEQIVEALKEYEIDLVVLAGYMKRLPNSVIALYPRRIINIHPSLLPHFGGKEMYGSRVHEAVLASGASITGATVHFVTGEYDAGEIIMQRECPVISTDSVASLGQRVLQIEHELLPDAIAEVAMNLVQQEATK